LEKIMPVETGAEAFIELLNANGVDYIFLNPGTDTNSIQQAISKFKNMGKRTPEAILCLHESVAMAAAHGYFMISGKPQVVIVHTDVGIQQAGGAVHNAQRGRIGVVLCSGRAPSSIDSGKTNQVHWFQEQFDQAGVVRGYVKWAWELRTNDNIHDVVHRAFQVASSEPCGPVYLCLPQDLLTEKISDVRIPDVNRYAAASTPQADNALLKKAASMLVAAKNPLIITGNSGRNPQSVTPLVSLAESIGARLIISPFRMNFPTTHYLVSGFESSQSIKDADVVLEIDLDVPYIPAQAKPGPNTKIIHIDIDAVKENYPVWGFPADILIQADSSKALPALNQIITEKTTSEHQSRIAGRLKQLKSEHRKMKEAWQNMAVTASARKPISPEWLCHCLGKAIDEDTIVLGEAVTNRLSLYRQVERTVPGTFFLSGGSSLGWGLGAALGAKLASPDKTLVSLVGDGSFVFGCPTAAIWAASIFHAPFLCIILNNERYNAPSLNPSPSAGADNTSRKTELRVGIDIKPSPDYAAIARACFAYGQTVTDPTEILPAIKTALEQVRGGTTAVLDVKIES
jgi:acetolactate synthase I/II/III large subunit